MYRVLTKFMPRIPFFSGAIKPASNEHDDWLLRPSQLRRRLTSERMRCDRGGGSFSFLVVAPTDDDAATRRLVQVLEWRLRESDTAGWLDQARLGLLLPDTPRSGAWSLAEAIRRRLPNGSDVEFEVFCYPGNRGDRRSRSGERAIHLPSFDDVGQLEHHEDVAQPLEQLLAVPLPRWKRVTDVVLSIIGLVLLAPFLAGVGIAVKLTSPGPMIFRQLRTGFAGRPFVLYKFRTMCVDAEELKAELLGRNEQDGPAFKIEEDPRVTPLGSFLRRTCIDELPQLWNVLKGEMTLVGPRPLPCNESAECLSWQQRRLDVTPGLTCFWQVSGSRLDFAEWMRLDLKYVRSRSALVDLRLLWRTFLKVIFQRASC